MEKKKKDNLVKKHNGVMYDPLGGNLNSKKYNFQYIHFLLTMYEYGKKIEITKINKQIN